MNEQLSKGLDLLISHSQDTMALERLISAMEACLEGKQYGGSLKAAVDAPVQPKHPLEDYKITEKDVGSLVLYGDGKHLGRSGKLEYCDYDPTLDVEGMDQVYRVNEEVYSKAKPYLDPIALHFIPFYATPDSVAPDDLGEYFAVLWNEGDVLVYNNEHLDGWQNLGDGYGYIIGYRPLKFVNPLKQDK